MTTAAGKTVSYDTTMYARNLIEREGGNPKDLTTAQINAVIRRTLGDVDLAVTAITMRPRPRWVAVIIPKNAGLPKEAES